MFIRSSVLITHTSMVICKKKNKTKQRIPPKKEPVENPKVNQAKQVVQNLIDQINEDTLEFRSNMPVTEPPYFVYPF